MEELKTNNLTDVAKNENENELNEIIQVAESMLMDVKKDLDQPETFKIPIAKISSLGAGVASVVPSLNTITQTFTLDTKGLYSLANVGAKDTLKVAKNGDFWGSFKTAEGKSKMLRLNEANPLSGTSVTTIPFNPATLMMAAALYSIDKKFDSIVDMQKEILDFLKLEKKAEIEADIETLMNIIKKYKNNWDNEKFIASNHKMVLDIQRTARKNMNFYQKDVNKILGGKNLIATQSSVKSKFESFSDKFKYYRLSLYTYSLASLLEIMLSGNFKEENISSVRNEILDYSNMYREIFGEGSEYLEKMSKISLEKNLLKGLGFASNTAGKAIGAIPVVKKGPVDEFLQDGGNKIKGNAADLEQKYIKEFSTIKSPGVQSITSQMDNMIAIYNHTSDIYIDSDNVYLLTK